MPLLDEYDVYEQLMDYWHASCMTTSFLIMNDGWIEAAKPRRTIEDKDRKLSETPDLVVGSGRRATKYKTDLIPPSLIVARFFTAEQVKLDELIESAETESQALEEFVEKYAVEDGPLAEAMDDDKISKPLATLRLKQVRSEGSDEQEVGALERLLALYNAESDAKRAVKELQSELDLAVFERYGSLTEKEIKDLVLGDKWKATLSGRVSDEVNSLTLSLVARIQQLGERYMAPLASLEAIATEWAKKVTAHLSEMGID